ncbi:MAG: hypothetical protein WDO56_19205 [Gammaproteobacteria bacterium]
MLNATAREYYRIPRIHPAAARRHHSGARLAAFGRRCSLARSIAVAVTATLLGACGGSNPQTPGPGPAPGPASTSATVSGVAGKGLLLNAIVNYYAVSNGVASTTSLATTRTDGATGAFSAAVSSSGPVLVTVSTDANTKMLDELAGAPVTAPSGLVLHAALDSLTNVKPIGVTPLTEMAYGLAASASGGLTTANINAAATAVDTAFLNGVPSLNTQPIDVTKYKSAPAAQQQLSKLLVAFAVAANQGTATDSTDAACNAASYGDRLVCMVGGLGKLLRLDASNKGTLQANANYIAAAYAQIDTGSVTVAGGQSPGTLGLDAPSAAQTALNQALVTQAALPGYDPGAAPLPNTKAFFADLRQNIIDQDQTQTFGLAPVLEEISDDIASNVHPALTSSGQVLTALKTASDLLVQSHTNPATGSPVDIISPAGIAVASNGDLYTGLLLQKQIVRISAESFSPFAGTAWVAGTANGTGAAATFAAPRGIAFDAGGNLYVADAQAHLVRKITPAGVVSTLAGQAGAPGYADGTGTAAKFNTPFGIAVDSAGNLYVTDAGNSVIRKITPAGVVTTVAGLAGTASEVDGVGSAARFAAPFGIAVDAAGNLYIAEWGRSDDPEDLAEWNRVDACGARRMPLEVPTAREPRRASPSRIPLPWTRPVICSWHPTMERSARSRVLASSRRSQVKPARSASSTLPAMLRASTCRAESQRTAPAIFT